MAPEHGLTDYDGHPVCSPRCNHIAYERKYGDKKKKRDKSAYEESLENQRRYQEKKEREANGKQRKPRYSKPVNIIRKADGSIMAKHPSVKSAAEATEFSVTMVSKVCRGELETRGDFTFEFAEKQQNTDGKAIWDRKMQWKTVVQLDLDGNLIARHDSQKAAALASGCSQSSVSLCCKHKQYQTRGFIFMFESEYEKGKKDGR
ncbi:MAG: hypothetical protein IKD07_07780 [Clostridia bacterium]|nr:hypothetical protein [Clostridia bacterium]